MEETKTNIEELLNDELIGKLNEETKLYDLTQLGFDEDMATIILRVLHKGYRDGRKEYSDKYYQLKFKYDALCISVCERLLLNEHA